MNIVTHLVSIGYKPFRLIDGGLVECNNPNDFSTMMPGKLTVRLIKDDSTFVYGLHERSKPPTLIHPRPKHLFYSDDLMNDYLLNTKAETIFAELYPLSCSQ
jgi:hypothetical protein